jgi:hypothetical protein
MLDDFKSVLQRLGAVKLDGTNAMQTNSLNITPNEKAALGGDEDELNPQHHRLHIENVSSKNERWMGPSREERMSLSGRVLDDGETLDDEGRSRRKMSLASSKIGKMGVKLPRLPGLGLMKSRAEKEARRNMETNKRSSDGGVGGESSSQRRFGSSSEETRTEEVEEEIPPWERVDFITALTDPDVEAQAGPKGKRKKG